MRKLRLALVLILVVALGAFCLTACGGGDVEGTYKFSSIVADGETYNVGDTVGEGDYAFELTEDYYVLELKSDGTFVMTTTMGDNSRTTEGNWELSEDKKSVILSVEDEDDFISLKRDGNSLIIEQGSDTTITLKK